MMNKIFLTDSYKITHWKQYPPGTEGVYSYFESRYGSPTLFFGLQAILMNHLVPNDKEWGSLVNVSEIFNANKFFEQHFGEGHFNHKGWLHIIRAHGGNFPIRIKAVPEGTLVPSGNVLMTVENTCPECAWVTNYIETLLVQVWYPCTVASYSRECKAIIRDFMEDTGADMAGLNFKLHDFGYRGSTSVESAGLGGAAHLVNFRGTDTLAGIYVAQHCYGEPCAGFSIPASEHSTMTAWGEAYERAAIENMLTQYPTGLVACVCDSYDLMRAVGTYIGKDLKDKVLARDGCLVVRPDSGDPPGIVLRVLESLGRAFGTSTNEKGFKVLDPHVRIIQGDGIDKDMIGLVLGLAKVHGWSADNIAFGSGGGLLQKHNRDDKSYAFKCSAVKIGGEWKDVQKKPVTMATKASKPGRLALMKSGAGYITQREETSDPALNELQTVYQDGKLLKKWTFAEIRERASL